MFQNGEMESGFNPEKVQVRQEPAWVTLGGETPSLTTHVPSAEEVLNELCEKIAMGSVKLLGAVGECEPPRIVMPLTVEPSKATEVNAAISVCTKCSRPVRVFGPLKEEIEYWKFLDKWEGFSKWNQNFIIRLTWLQTLPGYRYGALVNLGDNHLTMGDWLADTRPIHEKEAEAILKALQSLGKSLFDSRVDVLTDSMAVIGAWNSQVCLYRRTEEENDRSNKDFKRARTEEENGKGDSDSDRDIRGIRVITIWISLNEAEYLNIGSTISIINKK
ncbi:unnamed protein product [Mytilus edulis]|uniref:Uncharacterized protein n=1 Tax=Mytilus edulis TaxID=6550 RepID=A0A8S3QJX7_MYTED|nr:unnamed protein product [Mytilus edulis]